MSYALSGPSDYGGLTRLIGDSAGVRQQLDTLTQQAATGRIAETYAGLGSGATVSLDLRPHIAASDDVAGQHRRGDRADAGGADGDDADPAGRRPICTRSSTT